jgi:hypothetical protein
MELLPAIVGLAVVDSINPSALLATVALLLRGRRADRWWPSTWSPC